MAGFFIFIAFILSFYYGFRYIFRTEKRINAKITQEGLTKGLKVLFIRESTRFDGENPFPKIEISLQPVSTSLLGFNGEDIYYRIVTAENKAGDKQAFWVQIETVFFRPAVLKWKETDFVVLGAEKQAYKFK